MQVCDDPVRTIQRDPVAALLAAVAGIGGISIRLLTDDWIVGRTNCATNQIMGRSSLLLAGCVLAGAWCFVRGARRFGHAGGWQRIRYLLLLIALLLAWILPGPDAFLGGFMEGFGSWVRANVDPQELREWTATANMQADVVAPTPEYWPAKPASPALRIPPADWPREIANVNPDAVSVLVDRSAVCLCWGTGGAWSWTRMVIVMTHGDGVPAMWAPPQGYGVASQRAAEAIWIYVRAPV